MNLIFDFDGTLVDSFRCVIETFNLLSREYDFRRIDPNEIDNLKNLNSAQLIKHLEIPFYKIPLIIHDARKRIADEMLELPPFNDIINVLYKLHDAGFKLGILTSNSEENVTRWLKVHGLYDIFDFIYIESNYFGKKQILKKIITKYEIDKAKAFYFGDETRDIIAAKQCDIFSVAVTWGFNSEQVLTEHSPHYVVRMPTDILTILPFK